MCVDGKRVSGVRLRKAGNHRGRGRWPPEPATRNVCLAAMNEGRVKMEAPHYPAEDTTDLPGGRT